MQAFYNLAVLQEQGIIFHTLLANPMEYIPQSLWILEAYGNYAALLYADKHLIPFKNRRL